MLEDGHMAVFAGSLWLMIDATRVVAIKHNVIGHEKMILRSKMKQLPKYVGQ